MIIAGEPSGEMHGSHLIRSIRDRDSTIQLFGMGGDGMIEQGFDCLVHIRDMSFLGFIEVLRHLPLIRRVMKNLLRSLDKRKPDAVVLIDYPGFNLRFASRVRKRGIPVIYYISPQIWAWGGRRIKKIAANVDHMIVIFPFEKDLYEKANVNVTFVGHPLKDGVQAVRDRESFLKDYGLNGRKPVLALMPGSRSQEVERHLPVMIEAAERIRQDIPGLQVLVSRAPNLPSGLFDRCLDGAGAVTTVKEPYEMTAHADLLIVASGTATLEAAILGTPMIVIYKMSSGSFHIARFLVKLKNIALVNIVAGKTIVPELIQDDANAETLSETALKYLNSKELCETTGKELQNVSEALGNSGASGRAADVIMEMVRK